MKYIVWWITLTVYHSTSSVTSLKILPAMNESTIIGHQQYELTLTANASLTLTCADDGEIRWIYPENDNSEKRVACEIENGTNICNLTMNSLHYLDTGNFTCESKSTSASASIYIFVFDEENPIALDGDDIPFVHANAGTELIIPCKPTAPFVNVTLTGIDVEVTDPDLSFDPKVGYTLHTVQVADSGFYSCIATFNDSTLRDYTIQITVTPSTEDISLPEIDASGSYHLVEGDNATLNCSLSISEGANANLEWKLPNDNLKNVTEKIVIEENKQFEHEHRRVLYRTLTIRNLTKNDQGPYTCEVMDKALNTRLLTHYLHVYDENATFLAIIVQNESRQLTVRAGESQIKWVVNVTAHPRPAITWYDPDGKEIINGSSRGGKYYVYNDGQITKLEINKINIWDSGTYQIRAFNNRHKDAADLTLAVEDKPAVELQNIESFYQYGKTYSIECVLTANPLPKVTWLAKTCHNFTDCDDISYEDIPQKISNTEDRYEEIVMRQYQMKSIYKYTAIESQYVRCKAENTFGSSNSTSLYLVTDVADKDGFAANISSNLIAVGDNIEMTCGASRYQYQDNITWYLNRSDDMAPAKGLPGSHLRSWSTNFSYFTTLSISNVDKYHIGYYVCQAALLDRVPAQHTNRSVYLNVRDVQIPVVKHTNLNATTWRVLTGKPVKMEAVVDGIPIPTVIWYKDGKPIQIRQNDTRIILSEKNQTLLIRYAVTADEGAYSWIATNKGGNVSAKISLFLIDKPEEHEHVGFLIGFLSLTIFFGLCIIWSVARIRKEKKLRKGLAETGLLHFEEGAVNSLNPELGIEDQADLLPYDKKWEFPREKLKLGKQLGSGAFGVVMKAEADGIIDRDTSTTVAVKMVKRNADPLYIRALASELKIMIHLGRHLNVVNLLGACTRDINKRELLVIVEYCKYGNLHDFLLKQRTNFINQITEDGEIDLSITDLNRNNYYTAMNGRVDSNNRDESVTNEETPIGSDGYLINKDNELDWRSNYRGDYHETTVRPIKTADLICWSFQIARGMEYLASRKVLHGDLAARNVLLADDNIVKICDFGLAKSMYNSENYQRSRTELLPVKWMALESIRDRVFSTQSDVWSFGVTMWELFSLSITPYPAVEHLENLYGKLESGYRLEKPAFATKDIYAIMIDCWHLRPTLRPTFTELSERLAVQLEDGVRSQYTNLDRMYIRMNADMSNAVDYLAILHAPTYSIYEEEPRYVNVPRREVSDPEDDVELKPMLKKPDDAAENAKPICFYNPNYSDLKKIRRPIYVNTTPS